MRVRALESDPSLNSKSTKSFKSPFVDLRHPAVSGYLWRKWQGQVMELGRNIRLTFFFTLCLTWHIMTMYGGTFEDNARPTQKEMNTNDTTPTTEEFTCTRASDWFWNQEKGLGWDDPEKFIFVLFYSLNALTCVVLLVFIIR